MTYLPRISDVAMPSPAGLVAPMIEPPEGVSRKFVEYNALVSGQDESVRV
jgi:hypothetical protein